jgi:hypothetical protein
LKNNDKEGKEPQEVFEPTLENYLDIMYMMQLFAGYFDQRQMLMHQTKKEPHNIVFRANFERINSNLKILEPVLAAKQAAIRTYLNEKFDIKLI